MGWKSWMAAALLAAAWMAMRWPLPVWMLGDNDWLHQLGGANQILRGEHPFIDWHTDYGPFRYYPSAFAQWLFGQRTLAELLLVTAAYTVGYTLLFQLLWQASGRRIVAAALLVLALILAPRLFKYYVLLGPVVCLWAAWRYIDRPSPAALASLAAAVVMTGLFRADFGAFGAIAACAAIATAPQPLRARARTLALLLGLGLLIVSPWVLWLAAHGAVASYLIDTFLVAPGHAAAMSLPFPHFDPGASLIAPANAVFLLYVCYYTLPAVAVAAAFWPGVCPERGERRKIITAAVLAQAVLVHAAHRSDYSHLLQAIPIGFVLLAWLAGRALRYRAPVQIAPLVSRAAAAVFTLALVASLWAGVRVGGWPSPYAGLGLASIGVHALPRDEMLAYLAATHPNDPRLQAVHYLQRCTAAADRIVALPPWTGLYYFADRMFAGAQPNWSPGFFSAEADQRRWIDTVQRQDVPLIFGDFSRNLDGRAERTFETYSALVSEYVATEYVPIGNVGPIAVRGRRGLASECSALRDAPPTHQDAKRSCCLIDSALGG
jgi:hypothetical protein